MQGLNYDYVRGQIGRYTNSSPEQAFKNRFGHEFELPDTLNESHRSLIVAVSTDLRTERIVRYLSDLDVPINIATIQHFETSDGREVLGQVYLVEPEVAAAKAEAASKKRTYWLLPEILASAHESGVESLYSHLTSKASGILGIFANSRNLGFRPPHGSGDYRTLFDVNPRESDVENGLKIRMNGVRLMKHFELTEGDIRKGLPDGFQDMPATEWRGAAQEQNWIGFQGYFHTTEEIDGFWAALTKN